MTENTTRLVAPNGTTVVVSREKAERLASQGFTVPQAPRTGDDGSAAKKPSTPPRRPSRTEE